MRRREVEAAQRCRYRDPLPARRCRTRGVGAGRRRHHPHHRRLLRAPRRAGLDLWFPGCGRVRRRRSPMPGSCPTRLLSHRLPRAGRAAGPRRMEQADWPLTYNATSGYSGGAPGVDRGDQGRSTTPPFYGIATSRSRTSICRTAPMPVWRIRRSSRRRWRGSIAACRRGTAPAKAIAGQPEHRAGRGRARRGLCRQRARLRRVRRCRGGWRSRRMPAPTG